MSYASVAANNAPPQSQQPHPDLALLNTDPPTAGNIADDAAKLNVVAPDFKAHPVTITSQYAPAPSQVSPQVVSPEIPATFPDCTSDPKDQEAKNVDSVWKTSKRYLLKPVAAGGMLGLVNIGLFASAGYFYSTMPALRESPRVLAAIIATAGAVFGIEGFLIDASAYSSKGNTRLLARKHSRLSLFEECLLRPGVLGGFIGLANTAVIGATGYIFICQQQSLLRDRKLVVGVAISLVVLVAGEGFLVGKFRKE